MTAGHSPRVRKPLSTSKHSAQRKHFKNFPESACRFPFFPGMPILPKLPRVSGEIPLCVGGVSSVADRSIASEEANGGQGPTKLPASKRLIASWEEVIRFIFLLLERFSCNDCVS